MAFPELVMQTKCVEPNDNPLSHASEGSGVLGRRLSLTVASSLAPFDAVGINGDLHLLPPGSESQKDHLRACVDAV